MSKIVVIGSSNTDLVVAAPRMPEPGETIMGTDFMMLAGGKGANQAVAVKRLGGDVCFIANVGRDMFGDRTVENYKNEGMDISTILRDPEAPSGVALITVDEGGENSIVVAPGANNRLSCKDIDSQRAKIEAAEYLLLQLEIPMETVEYAVGIAYRAGVKIILNPAPAAALSDALLSKLYMITPNRTESQLLTGLTVHTIDEAQKAAIALHARGVKNVVITLGSLGALTFDGEKFEHVAAAPVKTVDTTAAGDTFNGAVCVALSEGRSLVEAVKFATRAAAISVTRIGAQVSIPYRKEIE